MRIRSWDTFWFSARNDCGAVKQTTDLAVVEQWRKKGRLVLVSGGSSSFSMVKNEHLVILRREPESVDKALKLWKKGYELQTRSYRETVKEDKDKRKEKFNETLIKVADAIESTNAQKAKYFRNAVPREDHGMLTVDFPTKGNKLKRTLEQFKREGKPYGTTTLYHGTRIWNIASIIRCGLKKGDSTYGMLGEGIYLGGKYKAADFSDLIIFQVKVALGNCKELEQIETFGMERNDGFDSLHADSGKMPGSTRGWLNNEEWIVRRPEQVEISKLVCGLTRFF